MNINELADEMNQDRPSFSLLLEYGSEDDRHWLNERAAIYEYDAGMKRELAESQAAQDFLDYSYR